MSGTPARGGWHAGSRRWHAAQPATWPVTTVTSRRRRSDTTTYRSLFLCLFRRPWGKLAAGGRSRVLLRRAERFAWPMSREEDSWLHSSARRGQPSGDALLAAALSGLPRAALTGRAAGAAERSRRHTATPHRGRMAAAKEQRHLELGCRVHGGPDATPRTASSRLPLEGRPGRGTPGQWPRALLMPPMSSVYFAPEYCHMAGGFTR